MRRQTQGQIAVPTTHGLRFAVWAMEIISNYNGFLKRAVGTKFAR